LLDSDTSMSYSFGSVSSLDVEMLLLLLLFAIICFDTVTKLDDLYLSTDCLI